MTNIQAMHNIFSTLQNKLVSYVMFRVRTYQGHDKSQSERGSITFSTVVFQQRANQRAPNKTNGLAITKNNKKENIHHQAVIRKFEMTPEMAPDHVYTRLTYLLLFT